MMPMELLEMKIKEILGKRLSGEKMCHTITHERDDCVVEIDIAEMLKNVDLFML